MSGPTPSFSSPLTWLKVSVPDPDPNAGAELRVMVLATESTAVTVVRGRMPGPVTSMPVAMLVVFGKPVTKVTPDDVTPARGAGLPGSVRLFGLLAITAEISNGASGL